MTEYRLLSEPSADLDVEAAFDWCEDERPGLGMEFLGELRAAYNRIAGGPHGYQDLRLGIRRALLRRFPYAVYFAVDGDVVVVIRPSGSVGEASPMLEPTVGSRRGVGLGFALFETAIGWCGIVWGGRGVVGVQLPEKREAETRGRVIRRFPDAREGAPPPEAQRAIEGIVALLRGEARDLSDVALDLDRMPPFHRRVYEVARTIRPGETLAYGEVAARLGDRGLARAVGQALGENPFAIVVPCHRVVAAGGKVGGFSANGGARTKLRLLAIEGAPAAGTLPLFDDVGALAAEPATK